MGKNPAVLTIAFHLLAAWPAGPLKRNQKCITSVICIHTLPSFLFSCSFPSRFSFFFFRCTHIQTVRHLCSASIFYRRPPRIRTALNKEKCNQMKLCGIGVEGRSEQEKTMRRYLKDAVVDVKSYWHVLHLVLIAESCLHVKGFPFSLGLFLRGQGYSPFFLCNSLQDVAGSSLVSSLNIVNKQSTTGHMFHVGRFFSSSSSSATSLTVWLRLLRATLQTNPPCCTTGPDSLHWKTRTRNSGSSLLAK